MNSFVTTGKKTIFDEFASRYIEPSTEENYRAMDL
jgi:hypothetical protein